MAWSKRKSKKRNRRFNKDIDISNWSYEVAYAPTAHGPGVETTLIKILASKEQHQ